MDNAKVIEAFSEIEYLIDRIEETAAQLPDADHRSKVADFLYESYLHAVATKSSADRVAMLLAVAQRVRRV